MKKRVTTTRYSDGSETVQTETVESFGCFYWFLLIVVLALPLQFPLPLAILAYLVEGLIALAYIRKRSKS